jgi:hypothetical protein
MIDTNPDDYGPMALVHLDRGWSYHLTDLDNTITNQISQSDLSLIQSYFAQQSPDPAC